MVVFGVETVSKRKEKSSNTKRKVKKRYRKKKESLENVCVTEQGSVAKGCSVRSLNGWGNPRGITKDPIEDRKTEEKREGASLSSNNLTIFNNPTRPAHRERGCGGGGFVPGQPENEPKSAGPP